ncbi:CHAP domain-containing protein [Nocardioides pantholopis]|uniref:CHAP domain-containing protein n=1 Tax=Nocardioides pantholopis TaxID=2483798 RepID=UPI000FD88D11|nr:CHAP domain-containing protein [Nocardioides pantholopis]
MHQQSQGSQRPRRTVAWLCWLALLAGLLVAPAPPASAASTYHCSGYSGCKAAGYKHFGYGNAKNNKTMWWRMYAGHNCTNYVAYRMVKAGMSTARPWSGSGNASNWGVAMKKITDTKPSVGAVAWWKANVPGAGSSGHVAVVEKVISPTKIVISEDSWGGTFHWRTITKGTGWPSGFVHFTDKTVQNLAPPTLGSVPQIGVPVTAVPGTWTAGTALSYQWLLDGAAIAGATGATYTPTTAQLGKGLAVRVTGSRSGHTSATVTSAAAAIGPGALVPQGVPAVEGQGYLGQALVASFVGWVPAESKRAVQWYADGVAVPGANGRRLVLGEGLLGKTVTVQVTGTAPGYGPSTVESAPIGPVYAGDVEVVAPPALSGETRPGATLRVTPPAAQPADSQATYTWLRDGAPIAGAAGPAYRLGPNDLGRRLAVRVDVQRPGYRAHVETLAAPAKVTTSSRTVVRRAVPGRGKVKLVIRVRVPGQAAPRGKVAVLTNGRTVRRRVVGGKLTLVVAGLRPGQRKAVVTYAGNSVVTSSRATVTFQVRKR